MSMTGRYRIGMAAPTVDTRAPAADRARRGVVTPEAVLLELDTAGVGTRTAAAAIDLFVQGSALALVIVALFVVERASALVATIGLFVAAFAALVAYPCLSEWLLRGRTVGKMAMGLRVVTVEGAPVRFSHAATRAMVGLVDFWLPPGGALAMLLVLGTPRRQRFGDVVAGTLVLAERRTAETATRAVWFTVPPGWDDYVLRLDTGRVTDEQYRLLRAYVLRTPSLSPAARAALAAALCDGLGRASALPRPAGVPAEVWVLAVAAAHQRRRHAITSAAAAGPGNAGARATRAR
jgi:uncharacterized RDD family membrane protein YckC